MTYLGADGADAEEIILGKTALVNGELITGTLEMPTLGSKTITENGTFNPADDELDAYNEVIVSVAPPVLRKRNLRKRNICG